MATDRTNIKALRAAAPSVDAERDAWNRCRFVAGSSVGHYESYFLPARLKLGPFWTPPLSVIVLRLEDREIRLNGLAQALRAQGAFDFTSWRIESYAPGVRARWTRAAQAHLPPSGCVRSADRAYRPRCARCRVRPPPG